MNKKETINSKDVSDSNYEAKKMNSSQKSKNKNTIGINYREINMLATNFCYGGEEIYEIENLKN